MSSSNQLPRTWTMLRPVEPEVLQRMLLYQSKTAFYLLGYYGDESSCRLLTFPKQSPKSSKQLAVVEDSNIHTPQQAEAMFCDIHSDPDEGLEFLCEAFGVLGCFRLLEGYYLYLITKRKPLGSLAGHTVYGIADTALIPLSGIHDSWAERRYRKLLLSGVDLTKDFFFSYTYNLSYTVQHNLTHNECLDPFDCIFVWNAYLTRDLRTALKMASSDNKWVLPLVHGSWQQRNLSIFGKIVQLTLISRRSRRFAGTRYLKRGINQLGWVANEVETEQIVSLQNPAPNGVPSLTSVVQIRGSIPLFWGQATSALNPRPSIQLFNNDPLYNATRLHFDDLFERYGKRVIVLNLVKSFEKHPRESILRKAFGRAISYLNEHVYNQDSNDITYLPLDFKARMRKDGRCFLKETEPLMKSCVEMTGFCCITPSSLDAFQPMEPQFQKGVLRTNCIDCLDRTNISQYLYGLMALGYQLCMLGLLSTPEIDPDCSFAYQFMQMYEDMGNDLALQYGGSEAHQTFFERMRGNSEAVQMSREFMRSIKRYYSNAVSDPEKQDAINLFLGSFIPHHDKADVWELESDYILHCGLNLLDRRTTFGLRASASLATKPSTISLNDNQRETALKLAPLALFQIPIISQAGDPEQSLSFDLQNRKDMSGWNLSSWLWSNPEPDPFRLPKAMKPNLDSFEEILSFHPIIEVRLHDGDSRRSKGGHWQAFQNTFARLQKQEALVDSSSGQIQATEADVTDSCIGCQSDGSLTVNTNSAMQAFRAQQSRFAKFQKLPTVSTRKIAQDFSSFRKDLDWLSKLDPNEAKSEPQGPNLSRKSWFAGLKKRATDSPKSHKQALSRAQRTLSTPTEIDLSGIHQLGEVVEAPQGRSDPVQEFWDEYWSITEQSLTNEYTLAEKISKASDKREALKQARTKNSLNTVKQNSVEKMTAVNVFLDELLDQCLENPVTVRQQCLPEVLSNEVAALATSPVDEQEESRTEAVNALGIHSNINELLFHSTYRPGDRILEKWFQADKHAEADYYRNLSWITSSMEGITMSPVAAMGI